MKKWMLACFLAVIACFGGFGCQCTTQQSGGTEDSSNSSEYSSVEESSSREESHVHNYVEKITDATCIAAGYSTYTCSCGDSYMGESSRAVGHSFGSWFEKKPSTELENGIKCRQCEVCDKYEEAALPKTGHEYIASKTVAPTCAEYGYTLYQCTSCDDSYKDDFVDKLSHDEKIKKVNLTCTEDGYVAHSCENCDFYCVTDYIPAMGHEYGEWYTIKEMGCTEQGEEKQECLHCEEIKTRKVDPTGHYFIIASMEDVAEGIETVYECAYCAETQTILTQIDEEEAQQIVNEDVTIVEQNEDFAFVVTAKGGESVIREELSIIDAYFKGTEYEDCKPIVQFYRLDKLTDVPNAWIVSPDNDTTEVDEAGNPYYESQYYENGTTFVARMGENVKLYGYYDAEDNFVRCNGSTLTFGIKAEESKENVIKLKEDAENPILFLRTLENENPGYYPYTLSMEEDSDFVYLKLQKIDGIEVGDILFIGEAETLEEIFTCGEECCFGKVSSIYMDGYEDYILALSCPDLEEVFSELDVSYDEEINFDNYPEVQQVIEEQAVDALYASEDFAKFIAVADTTVQKYYTDRNLSASTLTEASFKDKVQIDKPSVKVNGTTISITLGGHYKNEIKTKNGKSLGEFKIDFTAKASVSFNLSVDYRLKYKRILWVIDIPVGIKYFDISLTQRDTFSFDFSVDFNVDYELDKDYAQKYVYHSISKKIHVAECHYVKRTDPSRVIPIKAEELSDYVKKDGFTTCMICQPVDGLNRAAFIINTATSVVHCYDCYDVEYQMNASNKQVYYGNIKKLQSKGYKYCERCQPELKDKRDFEEELLSTMEYSDWSDQVSKIKEWAKNSGSEEYKQSGMKLCDLHHVFGGIFTANFELRLVLSFKFEAHLDYHYSQSHTNVYGIRVEGGSVRPYSSQTSSELQSELTIVGSMDFKIGVNANVYVSIAGLSQWVRAGFTAEAGLYVDLDGVANISNKPNVNNYAAVYFEAGPYVDVKAYYKLFGWNGEETIYSKKFPIFIYGYEKAYFGYVNEFETIDVSEGKYTLDLEELFTLHYYDVKNQKAGTKNPFVTKITIPFQSKPTVTITNYLNYYANKYITFEDGTYCQIKDGVITVKEGAPWKFTDTLIIEIPRTPGLDTYKKGTSAFFLERLEIEIVYDATPPHEHAFGEWITVTPATCMEQGLERRDCLGDECEEFETRITEKADHTHSEIKFDDEQHWYECICGEVKDNSLELHYGGEATTTEKAVCSICKHKYGELKIPEFIIGPETYEKRSDGTIDFGAYPQSKVTDANVAASLTDLAGALPTANNTQNWTSYKYYLEGSNAIDYMWYIDLEYGDGKYRGVYFTENRPYYPSYSGVSSYQDDNGYVVDKVYWFEWEVLNWTILEEQDETAFLLCNSVIDSQNYDNGANNYAESIIRKWLNESFYATAFTSLQQGLIATTNVDNSAKSTNPYGEETYWNGGVNENACENTNDKIFLLSEEEATNPNYGLGESGRRTKSASDYAQSQGCQKNSNGNAGWWLRSPNFFSVDYVRYCDDFGGASGSEDVTSTNYGIVPALKIIL